MDDNRLTLRKGTVNFFYWLICILTWVFIAFAAVRLVFGLMYTKIYVVGASMEGTLNGAPDKLHGGGDFVYTFKSSSPRRGDIVVIDTTGVKGGQNAIIKRVIALGGDRVSLADGVLYLNGEAKEEPYVLSENNTPSENNFAEITVPDGYMFCLGDNRDVSVDSRSEIYGCMPVSWVSGVVADWSLSFKGAITAVNTFFDFPADRR